MPRCHGRIKRTMHSWTPWVMVPVTLGVRRRPCAKESWMRVESERSRCRKRAAFGIDALRAWARHRSRRTWRASSSGESPHPRQFRYPCLHVRIREGRLHIPPKPRDSCLRLRRRMESGFIHCVCLAPALPWTARFPHRAVAGADWLRLRANHSILCKHRVPTAVTTNDESAAVRKCTQVRPRRSLRPFVHR